ncbi:hypothetical protein BN1723_000583 [Verticillium longisporum]|uniref:Uncharacterized protein n=1 Tax=Verticillium longisporum TaxID=100787 RepID=A0A0G4M6W2_VERLO|nr:hypothetical protein BN1723_000583 [Verticillium longisporum]
MSKTASIALVAALGAGSGAALTATMYSLRSSKQPEATLNVPTHLAAAPTVPVPASQIFTNPPPPPPPAAAAGPHANLPVLKPVDPAGWFQYGFPGPHADVSSRASLVSAYDRRTRNPHWAEVLRLGTEASADDTSAKSQPQQQDDVADRPMPELPFLGVSQEIVYRDEADPLIRVPQDDDFWIGAGDAFGLDAASVPGAVPGTGQEDVTWQHDEAAMRALIDEDFSRFIDPALGEGMFAME